VKARWLVVGLCAAGVAWFVSRYGELQTELEMWKPADSPTANYTFDLADTLYCAASELKVRSLGLEEPLYPDGEAAREHIEYALAKAKLKERAAFGERLARVRDSLPNEQSIRTFRGKPVDNSTFKRQRDELVRISNRFWEIYTQYADKRDSAQLQRRVDAFHAVGLVAAIVMAALIAVFVVAGVLRSAPKAKVARDQQAQPEEPERVPRRPFFP